MQSCLVVVIICFSNFTNIFVGAAEALIDGPRAILCKVWMYYAKLWPRMDWWPIQNVVPAFAPCRW